MNGSWQPFRLFTMVSPSGEVAENISYFSSTFTRWPVRIAHLCLAEVRGLLSASSSNCSGTFSARGRFCQSAKLTIAQCACVHTLLAYTSLITDALSLRVLHVTAVLAQLYNSVQVTLDRLYSNIDQSIGYMTATG